MMQHSFSTEDSLKVMNTSVIIILILGVLTLDFTGMGQLRAGNFGVQFTRGTYKKTKSLIPDYFLG